LPGRQKEGNEQKVYVRLESATSATSLTLRHLTLNKNRNRVVTSATVLMAKDLSMTFFGIVETRISSSLIINDLQQKRMAKAKGVIYEI
jgi:hypothetical protein